MPTSENLLAMIATTMERMNADRGLPVMQVLKFDGSPENYPVFRQDRHGHLCPEMHAMAKMGKNCQPLMI